jgi:hypothetical protein
MLNMHRLVLGNEGSSRRRGTLLERLARFLGFREESTR